MNRRKFLEAVLAVGMLSIEQRLGIEKLVGGSGAPITIDAANSVLTQLRHKENWIPPINHLEELPASPPDGNMCYVLELSQAYVSVEGIGWIPFTIVQSPGSDSAAQSAGSDSA